MRTLLAHCLKISVRFRLMKVGLPDGRFVDAVLVGLDPPGDVAVSGSR